MKINPFHRLLTGFLLPALISLSSCSKSKDQQQQTYISEGIIPLPSQTDLSDGNFTVDKNFLIVRNDSFPEAVSVCEDALSRSVTGYQVSAKGSVGLIFKSDSKIDPEGYILNVGERGVTIYASARAGAFYGAQSFRQILWNNTSGQKKSTLLLNYVKISDSPKYTWRGFHIDVSRHFFTKEYLMKTIDWLAYYKFNKFQIHLTDDQGWRIETDQFPLLTDKGAWRIFDHNDSVCMKRALTDSKYEIDSRFIKNVDGQTMYGGYYTKDDMREIINYAASRFIEVIPEIDMPGHMSAAINAYPSLSCAGAPGWGSEFSFPLCPCNQETMDFCSKVWDEMDALFPGTRVHIGSDEVEKDTWKASSACQSFMSENGISDVNGIRDWFVNHMQKYLETNGKRVIAWDDVIEGNVDTSLVLMYWRDWLTDEPQKIAANGNRMILTPWTLFYLSSEHTDASFKNLYEFNAADIYSSQVMAKVMGFQGCVWTEVIPSEKMFEYLVYPRLQALSEVAWTNARDWNSFRIRLLPHLKYMQSMNIGFRQPDLSQGL